ncbi:uncharacterized protein LOC144744498 [Ciona intestinalis]
MESTTSSIVVNTEVFNLSDSNISSIIVNQGSMEQPNVQRPTSICQLGQPIPHFQSTEKFEELHDLAAHNVTNNAIIHCSGFPGTGKSQIMRMLAKEFPFSEVEVIVKWHIECDDRRQSIKESFKELVQRMYGNGLAHLDVPINSILGDLDNERTQSFVDLLQSSNVPVLIVAEDVTGRTLTEDELFKDFKTSLANIYVTSDPPKPPIHVYIATRVKPKHEEIIGHYHPMVVTGFTEGEAIKYLFTNYEGEWNEIAATKIYKRFSGSPLGLRTAKAYCNSAMINYTEYIDIVENDEVSVYEDVSELLIEEYGSSVKDIFQAIIMPFRPESRNNATQLQTWKVMTCLSYLHFTCVPRFVVERFCQYFRTSRVPNIRNKNKTEAGFIIKKVKDHELCVLENGEDMTFHEVVFHAFRVAKQPEWIGDFNPVKCAIEVIASVSSKDMRDQVYAKQTLKLLPHLLRLLEHTQKEDVQIPSDKEFKLLLSHIYEVFGGVGCTESHGYKYICEEFLGKALEIVYEVAQKVSFREFLGRSQTEDIDACALNLVQKCANAGSRLPQGFIDGYESKVFVFRPESDGFKYLKKICHPDQLNTFEKVEKALKTNPSTTVDILRMLRACGVCLKEEEYAKIFFTERLASILHSLSRMGIYHDRMSVEKHKQKLWMSDFAYALSMQCHHLFETSLLFEHISRTGGAVPIILLFYQLLESDEKAAYLTRAKEMCLNAIEPSVGVEKRLYEHGLVMETKGSPYNMMNIQRHHVRIYTKMVRARGKYWCINL